MEKTQNTTFEDICDALNEYHNDAHYIVSFKVHGCIIVIKYGGDMPDTPDDMYLLIKQARREYQKINKEKNNGHN